MNKKKHANPNTKKGTVVILISDQVPCRGKDRIFALIKVIIHQKIIIIYVSHLIKILKYMNQKMIENTPLSNRYLKRTKYQQAYRRLEQYYIQTLTGIYGTSNNCSTNRLLT